MKNYITCIMIILFAQFSNAQDTNNFYAEQWEKVQQLENEGLTKSALDVVNGIKARAIIDKNRSQTIKSLLYVSRYALTLEEDAQLNIVNDFKAEIDRSDVVTKHVLENLLATMYWQYFQQSRYQFYNRTETDTKIDSNDFRTWDLNTIFNEIHTYYQRSLENGLVLQQERLEDYKNILIEFDNSKLYRPTLYDLLSHNALTFYKTDENSITKPAYQFKVEDTKLIGIGSDFMNLELESKDSTSLQLNALKIYQSLLRVHHQNNPDAYTAVNIERLNYVYNYAIFEDKDAQFIKTLNTEASSINTSPLSGWYTYELAQLYRKQGLTYTSNGDNDTHRWKLKDALALCNNVITSFPGSEGAKRAEVLKQQILQPSLQLVTEEHIPIQQWSRILVSYTNIDLLNFKLFKVTPKELEDYSRIYKPEERIEYLSKRKPIQLWNATLKNEGDYQTHSTEVTIPQLDNGLYIAMATPVGDNSSSTFATDNIQATNLALIESPENNKIVYQVIDRINGRPISGAKVKLTYNENGKDSKKGKDFITDRNGRFVFQKDRKYYRNIEVKVSKNDDTGHFGDYYISRSYRSNPQEKPNYNAYTFTDRSIYRPGQTVHYKSIVTKTFKDNTEVSGGLKATISLHDVNGVKVSETQLTTNQFGSLHGEFVLPSSGLTGEFYIQIQSDLIGRDYHYISVEEYKRPKFKTEFLPITETFKVNDDIIIKGNALAFAGSSITDAKVVYTVRRNVQFPRWFYWSRPYYNSEAQEITFGETTTNAKGEFEITFKALPDTNANRDNLPIFQYEVTADVTDINGETRSATTFVNVGYHTMTANIVVASQLDKDKKSHEITIQSQNLNGEYAPAKGTLSIYKLKAPNRVLRPRPWGAPDYQMLSETEFATLFPHEAYKDESQVNTWERGERVFSEAFDTETSKTVTLKRTKRWESGQYIIVLESKDNFGQAIKDEAYTRFYSEKDKSTLDNALFSINLDKDQYKAGDIAKVTLASASKDVTIMLDIEKDGKVIDTQIIQLNNSKKTISIPVNSEDVGGFAVKYSFAAYNSYRSGSLIVPVPYPSKDLQIETKTFRDKLKPGQEETWSFTVKGPKGDKVSAELLASMYDASLDEFRGHQWYFEPIQRANYYSRSRSNSRRSFGITSFNLYNRFKSISSYPTQAYDQLNWFGFRFGRNQILYKRESTVANMLATEPAAVADAEIVEEVNLSIAQPPSAPESDSIKGFADVDKWTTNNSDDSAENNQNNFENIQIRKNLQETAFFFPTLQTDAEGNVSFNFTAPEALTKWKLQLLAHTKALETTVTTLETVTQKELMVIPNAPRFLREGDQITISTKISNLTENALKGNAKLELTDAVTGAVIDTDLGNTNATKSFAVDAKGNTQVSWDLSIPDDVQAVQYTILAKTENFGDGEQNALPVLSNRMLVTETLPMWVRSNETRTFTLDKLKNTTSTTLKHHKLTLEMTSNPAWYAVQALPYLMEYPYDCNEQTFSRYYANALAQHIVKSNPKIEAVFNQWKSQDALLSNLEKNQELKSLLIQETPWLRDAQSEAEQKKRIGLLFDLNKMNNELQSSLQKLRSNQSPTGGWPWFKGGRTNRYITQHIIAGFGHLKQLNVTSKHGEQNMVQRALAYLDEQFVKEYKDLKRYNKDVDLSKDHLSYMQLHYLYTRSSYPEIQPSKEVKDIMDYYHGQIKAYWLKRSLYAKGLMTLAMHRMNDSKTAQKIIRSLRENSITSDELGMYWKANTNSWYWYQASIETQALLIEAFSEVDGDIDTIDNLKIWLLKNKQTNKWETTKATTEAVYALLLQGSDWLSVTEMVNVSIGDTSIDPSQLDDVQVEAGTGYYKTSWTGAEVAPEMAKVTLTKKGDGIAWGGLYWQYFEDLDKITSAETPLQLKKKLFVKSNTDTGEVITEITSDTQLKVGDLVRVRIELRSDRDMEFVHMKDMRAAGLEPIDVISRYKWQDGLGYYQSTKDAATNFFFDYLPKGVYVFEYDLRVNNAGDMSNGITTIQSMYAPEFTSHSEGVRVKVK